VANVNPPKTPLSHDKPSSPPGRPRRLLVWLIAIALFLLWILNRASLGLTRSRILPTPTPQAGLGESVQFSVDEFWGTAEYVSPALLSAGLTVDNLHRETSAAFYYQYYLPSEGVDTGWTGSYAKCAEGTTSRAFRDAIVWRINYFRAMAGVPAGITLDDDMNAAAQKAALLMAANGRVSHAPDSDWLCYSEQGDRAAGSSNLYAGVFGPEAIDGYIEDPGNLNYHVPHRRWLLYPNTRVMGTGDIPADDDYLGANALLVWGPRSQQRPQTRDGFVAWPPPGYVPYSVVFPRWSFSYPDADFSQSSLSMTRGDEGILLTVWQLAGGYGENTVVWEPQIPIGMAPERDLWYTVHINDVGIGGVSTDFTYTVILYDPTKPYES
jgi:uncharacterized protein YkwD